MVGPTAAGKTEVAIEIAHEIGAEIISVDSMQVYRGMDIGTAKPTIEERRGIAHHMIDVVDPEEDFSVAEFRAMARQVVADTQKPLVVTGGSGLHFRALVDRLSFAPTDPELRRSLESTPLEELVARITDQDPSVSDHIDLANRRRVVRALEILILTGQTPSARMAESGGFSAYETELAFVAAGIDPGEVLHERIHERLEAMIERGLVDEVRGLRDRLGRNAAQAVGYKEILAHLDGEQAIDEALGAIGRNTRQLAKKQRTWFQRDPRIRWIRWSSDPSERVRRTLEVLT